MRSTILIWLRVITGMSAPGTMTSTPTAAFWRAVDSMMWSTTAGRSAGTDAASATARSPALAAMR